MTQVPGRYPLRDDQDMANIDAVHGYLARSYGLCSRRRSQMGLRAKFTGRMCKNPDRVMRPDFPPDFPEAYS